MQKNGPSGKMSQVAQFFTGGLAQLARAPALHAGGQRFDSVILHLKEMVDQKFLKF